jgi:transposase
MARALYVFGNRRRDRIRILAWDGNGFWLMMKRLEATDRLIWPDSHTSVVMLSAERLHWLLDGVDVAAIAAIEHHPKRHYARVS